MAGGNHYAVLGALPTASHQELKSCYQQAALKYHPDKLGLTCSDAERSEALQLFCRIDAAWRVLGNDVSRRTYDAKIAEQKFRKPLPLNEEVPLDEMEWNEDDSIYTYGCRCGGEYVVTDEDIEEDISIISCNTCTLSIHLLLSNASQPADGDMVQPT